MCSWICLIFVGCLSCRFETVPFATKAVHKKSITVTPHEHIGRLKSPTIHMRFQKLVKASNKSYIKDVHFWPFVKETSGDRWIYLTKGQLCGQRFCVGTSSYLQLTRLTGYIIAALLTRISSPPYVFTRKSLRATILALSVMSSWWNLGESPSFCNASTLSFPRFSFLAVTNTSPSHCLHRPRTRAKPMPLFDPVTWTET